MRNRWVKGQHDYRLLSSTLLALSNVQFNADFFVFGETVKDYVALLVSIKVKCI